MVIAGSLTRLPVRLCYSQGGRKSWDRKPAQVPYWRRSGFDQPTWIDVGATCGQGTSEKEKEKEKDRTG